MTSVTRTAISQTFEPGVDPPALSQLRCVLVLLAATISLRALGLQRSIALVRRFTATRPAHVGATTRLAEVVAHRIAAAAAFLPIRALCLEQSLALFWSLRSMHLDAQLVLGVQPYPFLAHAWVEYRQQAVAESFDKVASLVPILRVRAP